MVKPKVMSEVPVLIHDIMVRSYAARVRSRASLVDKSSSGALSMFRSAVIAVLGRLPVPRYAVCRTPQQEVRQQSQECRDDERLLRIKPAEFDDLVNEVNDDGNDEDLGDVFPAFPQQIASIVRIADNDPAIGDAVFAGIIPSGAKRKKGGRRRLQNQPQRQWSANPPNQIRPQATEDLHSRLTQSTGSCAVVELADVLGESKNNLQSFPLPMRRSISNNAK